VQLTLETLQRSSDRDSPERIAVETIGKGIRPKTDGQSRYVRMMKEKDVTICVAQPVPARPTWPPQQQQQLSSPGR
jgi:phosphate starvation-inducible protein PhoH